MVINTNVESKNVSFLINPNALNNRQEMNHRGAYYQRFLQSAKLKETKINYSKIVLYFSENISKKHKKDSNSSLIIYIFSNPVVFCLKIELLFSSQCNLFNFSPLYLCLNLVLFSS